MTLQEINEQIKQLEQQRYSILQHNPTVCGIGYLGDNYNKTQDKLLYQRWNGIIQRCYNSNTSNYKNYGEIGIIVAPEWHNFSNFKEWFLDNYWNIGTDEKLVVDKDILVPNNKIYSSETCLLVPISFNSMFSGMNDDTNVIEQNNNGRYTLKLFKTTFSNFLTYDSAKQTRTDIYKTIVNHMLENYPTMPDKVKNAILNYQF
jgi:hypothetical protein